jgi:hypothetical protein
MPMYRAGANGLRLQDGRGQSWAVPAGGLILADRPLRDAEGEAHPTDATLLSGFVLVAFRRGNLVGDVQLETKA